MFKNNKEENKKMNIFDLSNTTFIIPLYIDTEDRLNNTISVLGFLNKNFNTNVIIHELVDNESKLDFISSLENLNIKHLTEKIEDKNYHRTRQLNEMLSLVKTDVVCNYDIDVLLPVTSYIISEKLLYDNIFDVIYPYGFGKYQVKIEKSVNIGGVNLELDRAIFNENYSISNIENELLTNDRSEYGHCMFFRTDSYKSMGGENENFISYGPEDYERFNRCERFNFRIYRIKDYVYHFEHSRTNFSNKENPDFIKNENLFRNLKSMSDKEHLNYYKSQDYIKKYGFKIHKNENKFVHGDMYIIHEFMKNPRIFKTLPENIDKNEEELKKYNTVDIFNSVAVIGRKLCKCGEVINKIDFNFCQRCNKIYE
jgi:hypothetical protein